MKAEKLLMTGLGTPSPWMLADRLHKAISVLRQYFMEVMPLMYSSNVVPRRAQGLSYLVDDAIRSLTYLLDLLILHAAGGYQ